MDALEKCLTIVLIPLLCFVAMMDISFLASLIIWPIFLYFSLDQHITIEMLVLSCNLTIGLAIFLIVIHAHEGHEDSIAHSPMFFSPTDVPGSNCRQVIIG